MNWKNKAKIQNFIAALPESLSFFAYYQMQKRLGKLESSNPLVKVKKAVAIAQRANETNNTVKGAVVFELGTGYRLNVPIALWLMGAEKIYTVDLNPYLKWELIVKDLRTLSDKRSAVSDLLGQEHLDQSRWTMFIENVDELDSLEKVLLFFNIEFKAPANAEKLEIEESSIDIHLSNDVLEHIPPDTIASILFEAKRMLRPGGVCVHMVDFTDHFSHSDKSISAINFLRFSDEEWEKIAGNRFMYMNRLRVDDIKALFAHVGFSLRKLDVEIDKDFTKELNEGGFVLDSKFLKKDPKDISVSRAWYLAVNGH